MATEKIRIDYVVDKKQLDASNESLKKSAKANDLVQKEVDQTTEKFKKQDKQLSKTNKLFSGLGGQLTALGNRFQIAGKGAGDMAAGLFKTTAATSGLSKGMKILKVAIAGTGIGLLVIGIAALVTAFKSSESGQNKFKKIMDVIGVVVGNLTDVLANLGEKIISVFENPKEALNDFVDLLKKNVINRFNGLLELIPSLGAAITQLFSGDFAGAAETAGNAVAKVTLGVEDFTGKVKAGFNAASDAVKDFTEQTKKEVETAAALADKRAATDKLERKFRVRAAKMEQEVASLRLKFRQEDEFTAEQRLAFLNKANEIQTELIDTELTIAANRAEEQRIGNSFSKSTTENLNALADLEVAVEQVQTRRLNQQRTLQRDINTVTGQTEAIAAKELKTKQDAAQLEKDIADEKAILDAEELQRKKDGIFELELYRLESESRLEDAEMLKRANLLENLELTEEERALIIAKSEAKIMAIKEGAAKTDEELNEAVSDNKLKGLQQTTSALKGVLNEESAIGKAAAIAQIGIQTQVAASAALSVPPLGLGPIAGIPLAGLTIASGLLSAGKVAGITPKFERGGRIGGNLHSGGGTMIEGERDEFMMSRKATSKYGFDLMNKINNLELNDLTGSGDGSSINIIDTNPIAEELKKMATNVINVDSEGFMLHQKRGANMISQKIERYST